MAFEAGETIWVVMRVTQASIPVAWRVHKADAIAAQMEFADRAKGVGEYYFVLPITNEINPTELT